MLRCSVGIKDGVKHLLKKREIFFSSDVDVLFCLLLVCSVFLVMVLLHQTWLILLGPAKKTGGYLFWIHFPDLTFTVCKPTWSNKVAQLLQGSESIFTSEIMLRYPQLTHMLNKQ